MSQVVYAPISIGELIDKITILEIKQTKTTDISKLKNILVETGQLMSVMGKLSITEEVMTLKQKLRQINEELWDIEDAKRRHERNDLFDSDFIQLARDVYIKNDLRASIKRRINLLTDSEIIEEKIY